MSTFTEFPEIYRQLSGASGPSPAVVRAAFDAILSGAWTPVQVAGFLVALRAYPASPEILLAAAQSMRGAMVVVEHGFDQILDTCGTGGDGQRTVNLSTAAAIIAASGGTAVAKHGNRAISSKAGSADVLEALGIPLDLPPEVAGSVLGEARIAFLLAPVHHPAMRHAAVARRELGIRTLFNALGPLGNPARATHQLIGTYEDGLRRVFAEVLRELGTQRAWVVHGHDGLDEVSPFGPTRVTVLDGGSIHELEVVPEDFGVRRSTAGSVNGGDAAYNASVIERILAGMPHPSTDAVVLNAASALVVAHCLEPKVAAERARELIATGAALRTLERWRAAAIARRPTKAES
ncbi:MAG: anthranilate phosphoribosyltransferase [Polyangiaceae bacterium]|nr:anthranilate phosphoribosyltransferase [Polyangiaceae bacterium]